MSSSSSRPVDTVAAPGNPPVIAQPEILPHPAPALSERGHIVELATAEVFRTLNAMEVHFNPDLQAKLDKLATETGRPTGELVEDAVLGYFDELAKTRETLNSRYDDLKSGRVQPIDGEEALPV